MSLMHSGMAAWTINQPGGKLPPGVAQANVDFVNRNEARLKELEGLMQRDGCGDDGGEDDDTAE
jgi:hypothetical protein